MRTLHAVLLALLVLVLAAPALADNEVVRELTSQGGVLGPDYLPKKQEYRLDPSTEFHYSSDPFLREKTGDGVKEAKKPSPRRSATTPSRASALSPRAATTTP